ncbi:MAG: O-methyltransferase [Bacteroidetes bacterium]|nr:O-methyltransferase [Bacteroidota bacterium]
MRDKQTNLTPELFNYIENNFNAENDFLRTLVNNCYSEAGIPQINITGYQANFLQFIIKLIDAKNILEIGTLAGYSAISMALSGNNIKKIITIEKNTKHYNYAKQKVNEANLTDIIELVNADAKQFLKNYNKDLFDLVFVDADKPNYNNYLELVTPLLRHRGVCVFDNAFAFGFLLDSAPEKNEDSVKSILRFHKKLLARKDYFTTIVPIGDGMLLSVKVS